MKNNFLYPVSVSGTTLLCDRDLIELVRQKGGDQLAEVLANRLSHEKIKEHLLNAKDCIEAVYEYLDDYVDALDAALDLVGDEE